MGNIQEVSDDQFDSEVLSSSQPVLVDFWAPWCGPCRMLVPVLEQLAAENAGSVRVVKINVDESPNAAMNNGVANIPTLVLYKDGQVFDRFVGIQPKARLQEAINQALA
jgi:thioredoxin 1